MTLLYITGEGNVNGFGLEFYIETPADDIADSVDDIKRSWQFQLLYTVSQLAAGQQHKQSLKHQLGSKDWHRWKAYASPCRAKLAKLTCSRNFDVDTVLAGHGSIRSILDDMKLLSTEAEGVNVAIPEADRQALVNSAGRVGALLGLKSSEPGVFNSKTQLCA